MSVHFTPFPALLWLFKFDTVQGGDGVLSPSVRLSLYNRRSPFSTVKGVGFVL